jgi:hypothetical protein
MVRIEFVLPYTQANFELTGAPIGSGSAPSTWNEEQATSIKVTRGAVGYSAEDGTFTLVTPAGVTKLTDLWPTPVVETPTLPPAVETPAPEAPAA